MTVYVFQGGGQIVEVKGKPIQDLEVKTSLTHDKFVPLSTILTDKQAKLLKMTLADIYDTYMVKEFAKMGYQLVDKKE